MATAKTPKSTPAKPAVAKLAIAKAASAAKPAEDAVVHSTEIAAEIATETVEAAAQAVEAVAEAPVETVTVEAPKVAPVPAAKPVPAPVAEVAKATEEKVLKGMDTFLEFSRDNAILLVSAGNELALGLHKLSLSLIDWSAESCDKGVAGASALFSAKTVEEVIDLSQSLAKDSLQQILKESSELGSLSTKLLEDTLVALPGRMVAAVEKLTAHTH